LQIRRGDLVALFRYNLKRRLDSAGVVKIHQRRTKVAARGCFYVMRDDRASAMPFRPEPDKREALDIMRTDCEDKQLLEEQVYATVNGPGRKWNCFPVS